MMDMYTCILFPVLKKEIILMTFSFKKETFFFNHSICQNVFILAKYL